MKRPAKSDVERRKAKPLDPKQLERVTGGLIFGGGNPPTPGW